MSVAEKKKSRKGGKVASPEILPHPVVSAPFEGEAGGATVRDVESALTQASQGVLKGVNTAQYDHHPSISTDEEVAEIMAKLSEPQPEALTDPAKRLEGVLIGMQNALMHHDVVTTNAAFLSVPLALSLATSKPLPVGTAAPGPQKDVKCRESGRGTKSRKEPDSATPHEVEIEGRFPKLESPYVVMVVPTYADMVLLLSYLREPSILFGEAAVRDATWNQVPKDKLIEEWVGPYVSSLSGGRRLWVTTEDTFMSFVQVNMPKAVPPPPAPFTHVIFPGISSEPGVLFHQILSRLRLSSRAKIVVPSNNHESYAKYLIRRRVVPYWLQAPPVESMTFEQVHKLVNKDVLEALCSSKHLPHSRVVDHCAQVAIGVVRKLLDAMPQTPQVVAVFTHEVPQVISHFEDAHLPDCVIKTGSRTAYQSPPKQGEPVAQHTVLVLNQTCWNNGILGATVVLDMGTTCYSALGSKKDGFFTTQVSDWMTKDEQSQRLLMLYLRGGRLYVELFDTLSRDYFGPPNNVYVKDVSDVESAILHCTRADLHLHNGPLVRATLPDELLDHARNTLARRNLIVGSAVNGPVGELTFSGQFSVNLRISTELSNFVLLATSFGRSEAAAIIAAVVAYPFFSDGTSIRRLECQKSLAPSVISISETIADGLIFVQWLQSVERGGTADAQFAKQWPVDTGKLQGTLMLFRSIMQSLADFTYTDGGAGIIFQGPYAGPDAALLTRVTLQLESETSTLATLLSVALSRRAAQLGHILADEEPSGTPLFLRTSKTVWRDKHCPSCVTWKDGNVVVSTAVRCHRSKLLLSGLTSISEPHFMAAQLLLQGSLDYSAPTDGKVHFAVTCHTQNRRYAASQADADRIMAFRDKVGEVYTLLQKRRFFPHAITKDVFLEMVQKDGKFNLEERQDDLREAFNELVRKLVVSDYVPIFDHFRVDLTNPKGSKYPIVFPSADGLMCSLVRDGLLREPNMEDQLAAAVAMLVQNEEVMLNSRMAPMLDAMGSESKEGEELASVGLTEYDEDCDMILAGKSHFDLFGSLNF